MRTPRFGDRVTAIYAGKNNPLRHGFYVRTVKRSGGLNPGTYYEITNGKGDFGQFPPESIQVPDKQEPALWDEDAFRAGYDAGYEDGQHGDASDGYGAYHDLLALHGLEETPDPIGHPLDAEKEKPAP